MHSWDDFRFFLSVARSGTVSAAAEKLGVNQSTVSRRINGFEKEMQVRLFERLSTGYRLTGEGEELLRRVARIEDEFTAIDRQVMGKNVELRGPIRLTTSLAMMDHLLMPMLAAFNRLYPGIEIQLDLSDNLYNLTQREADIALRVSPDPPPENLIGRKLGSITLGVYGQRQYLKRYLGLKRPGPLRWIGEDNRDPRPAWLHPHTGPLALSMRSNDLLATLSAIRHGLGVGRLPRFMGDRVPQLMRLEDAPELPSLPLWLLTHVDMRQINRMRVFNAYLGEQIGAELSRIPGTAA